jgi:DNA-binding MarR family transcriptional regulator
VQPKHLLTAHLKIITMILLSKELRRLSKLYTKAIAKELPVPHTEYLAELMLILSAQKEFITQKELTEHMQVDKSRMVVIIEELNRLGYLFTERNPVDRREHFVFLTEHGKKLLPGIKKAIDNVDQQIRQQLDPAGIAHFFATIQQMEQNLLIKP